jgi:hypothetical protein
MTTKRPVSRSATHALFILLLAALSALSHTDTTAGELLRGYASLILIRWQ